MFNSNFNLTNYAWTERIMPDMNSQILEINIMRLFEKALELLTPAEHKNT